MLLGIATLASIGSVAATLGFPVLTRELVDQMAGSGFQARTLVLLAGTLLAANVLAAAAGWMLARVGSDVVARMRATLLDRLLHLPVSTLDRNDTGDTVSRVISDCQSISELVSRQAVNLLTGVLMLIGSVVVLLMLDARLTAMLIGSLALAFAIVIPLSSMLDGLSRRIQDRNARLSGLLTHVFSEIRLVKASAAEDREQRRGASEIEELRKLGVRVAGVHSALEPIVGMAMTAATVAILAYGAGRVSAGLISIGTLTAFILYIFNVVTPLVQLMHFTAELQKAKGASARITQMLQLPREADHAEGLIPAANGGIEFRNVSFTYPGREEPVLRGIDLVLREGLTTALVGSSGSGKSTLLSLLERFYEPDSGRILHAERPISEYSLRAWRSRIGYVAQNAPVMPGTVRDNLCYGLDRLPDDGEILLAAAKAGAREFISQMPQGLDTVLIEQGNNLSGGQRQRIAIARMFLRDPQILILDEATSSLDGETEHQVKLALDRLMLGRTNVVVAHRLSTIMNADRICFLEDGRISGAGSHIELLATHPHYARLVERQFNRPLAPSPVVPVTAGA
nr:transporter [Paracoccus alcaliphilus]